MYYILQNIELKCSGVLGATAYSMNGLILQGTTVINTLL